MTNQHHPCQGCERPTQAYACPSCTTALTTDLATLGWLDDELTTTRTRQARLAGNGRRTTGDAPLPYGTRAAHVQDQLRNAITTWARDIDPGCEQYWTATVDVLCWVIARAHPGQHPAVGELINEAHQLTTRALDAINPDPDDLAYGQCGTEQPDGDTCDAHLHGAPGDTWVRCPRCRTQHEVRALRTAMHHRFAGLYLHAATLARVLPRLTDRPVSAAMIRVWAARGKPIALARDEDGEPLDPPQYRVGDVITVAVATPTRQPSTAA